SGTLAGGVRLARIAGAGLCAVDDRDLEGETRLRRCRPGVWVLRRDRADRLVRVQRTAYADAMGRRAADHGRHRVHAGVSRHVRFARYPARYTSMMAAATCGGQNISDIRRSSSSRRLFPMAADVSLCGWI